MMESLSELARARLAACDPSTDHVLAGVLSRESVRDLAVLYAMAIDASDVDALELTLHPDVVFDLDGVVAHGRNDVVDLLRGPMTAFRRMVHTPETHVVHVEDGAGVGVATAHAELVTAGGVTLAAHEYEDTYGVHQGRWAFTSRKVRFVYATRSTEFHTTLPREERVHMPGERPRVMSGSWFHDKPR